MPCTLMDIDRIIKSLTEIKSYNDKVWHVEFGAGLNRYRLMYDTSEVASHIHLCLQNLVAEAIHRALAEERKPVDEVKL